MYNYGTAKFTDSTISGNSASERGGGMWNYGAATLTDCTISGNAANEGGGVYILSGPNSRMTIVSTIVAGNIAAIISPDLFGTVTDDLGFNLVGDGTGASGFTAAGDQVGTAASPIDPLLAPLGDYGGPTQTMALRAGSPAIGKGVAIAGITTDQRGFALDSPRPAIGAFQTNPLVVNTAGDGIGSLLGNLNLRQAVNLANVIDNAVTITFAPTVFAAHQTIRLTAGQIELSDPSGLETITGPAAGLTIDAGGTSRVFVVDGGVTAALSGLTITGGSVPRGLGGGLENFGTVTLTDCTVSGNSASGGLGGGLWNGGLAMLSGSTFSGNTAYDGGGVYNYGTAKFTDSTISGNSASERAGGVWNYGAATLTDCTISGNAANEGGGVYMLSGPNSRMTIVDTIVAGNAAAIISPDLFGTVTDDRGYNLIGDGAGASGLTAAGDQVGTAASPIDPLLARLGDYGGPTQTMPLLPGSPAIGKGIVADYPGTTTPITTDQRGMPLDSPNPDLGAFQSQGFILTPVSGSSSQAALTGSAFANPLAVTVMANNPVEPVAGGIVSFAAPPSGASAVLSSSTATIGSNGVAATTATANNTAGSYNVTASATGVATPAHFALTNKQALTITSLASVSPNPRNSAVSSVDLNFSEPVNTSSLTSGALVLTDDNSIIPIGSGVTLALVSGTTSTYSINGLASLTAAQGEYKLTVNAADIEDQNGIAGAGDASTSWLMDTTAPSSEVINSLGTSQSSDTFSIPVSFSDPAPAGGGPAPGVASVQLFVSVNNGPFALSQTKGLATPEASGTVNFTFVGQDRNTYAFHSITTDAIGNTETKSTSAIEASTSVPDLHPPITHVLSSTPTYSWGSYPSSDFSGLTASTFNQSKGAFTLNWAGVDPDQNTGTPTGSIKLANIYVEVDGNPTPTLIGQLSGGSPNSNGVYTGSITYIALADGDSHTYAFFSVGIDDEQKAQAVPTTPDVTFTEVYSASLAATLEVEKGIAERSFIQYLDVNFNQTVSTSAELQALQTEIGGSNRSANVELLWFGKNPLATNFASEGSVNLSKATMSLTGRDLSINFGSAGITSLLTETGVSGTGTSTTNFGDGWYALGIDPAGNFSSNQTIWLTFFRLFGSVTGDETVSGPYTATGMDANVVYSAEGQSGSLLDADVDGSGAVNSKDLTYTVASKGDSVGATAPSDFPQFQLFAGSGTSVMAALMPANATPITQQEVQSLVPAAIAAWQAAGLDTADVRKLESTPIVVGNLGANILGEETSGVITINQTAAGYNWYLNGGDGSHPSARPRARSIC